MIRDVLIRFPDHPIYAALVPFVKRVWSLESGGPICDAPRKGFSNEKQFLPPPCFPPRHCGRWFVRVVSRSVPSPAAAKPPDPWQHVRLFLGKWKGDSQSQPGSGKTEREYRFTLNNRFIHVTNRSVYPPKGNNPKGKIHEDVGFLSYDKGAKKLVLRQFHVEGFVNQYDVHRDPFSPAKMIAVEEIWRARRESNTRPSA